MRAAAFEGVLLVPGPGRHSRPGGVRGSTACVETARPGGQPADMRPNLHGGSYDRRNNNPVNGDPGPQPAGCGGRLPTHAKARLIRAQSSIACSWPGTIWIVNCV